MLYAHTRCVIAEGIIIIFIDQEINISHIATKSIKPNLRGSIRTPGSAGKVRNGNIAYTYGDNTAHNIPLRTERVDIMYVPSGK